MTAAGTPWKVGLCYDIFKDIFEWRTGSMPAANLLVLVKLTGGFLPPNSRAGDIEIYDSGLLRIFESDTDVAETTNRTSEGSGVFCDLLGMRGFFQQAPIFHDEGSGTAPDVNFEPDGFSGEPDSNGNCIPEVEG
ncbi:MAG: hypothetical protein KatS3mg087_0654 [Patescibacteria group bacterium]|nr:MAG: hypothetical protein KatS3mg087_0654 [Patescibacteria group bacterium]